MLEILLKFNDSSEVKIQTIFIIILILTYQPERFLSTVHDAAHVHHCACATKCHPSKKFWQKISLNQKSSLRWLWHSKAMITKFYDFFVTNIQTI
jgi:hypothetical protein